MKINCWEYKKCGREPNGSKVDELGICPSSTEEALNGVHGGKNAGRACWVVAGTLCNGMIQGTFAKKYNNCFECNFFKTVKEEEGSNQIMAIALLNKIRKSKVAL
jgi:hypothetical protein